MTPRCGIKIPVTTPDEAISTLSDTIVSLAADRTRLDALSQGAIERAGEYLWEQCAVELRELYERILGNGAGRAGRASDVVGGRQAG